MNTKLPFVKYCFFVCLLLFTGHHAVAQVIISQYYEGTGTNKWIELTNTGNTTINTASPQLKLGIWAVTGSTGNITFTGAASSTVNLTVTIPPYGSVLIGNTGNGTEIAYLTAASAAQTSNTVINFNGNDGVALLDASNNIIDQFGNGINATDISYVRNTSVTTPSATYVGSQWTSASIATVQAAGTTDPNRLNYQLSNLCTAPASQATGLSFGSPTSTSNTGSFTATTADGYLIVYSTSATLTANPADGTTYTAGTALGSGTVLASGTGTSLSMGGLTPSATYYVTVFAYNNIGCSGGPAYKTASPLSGSFTTLAPPCTTPASQATGLSFGSPTSTSNTGSFTATTADGYLTVYSTSATLTANPADGTTYTAGAALGNGTVLATGSGTSLSLSSLTPSTTYYVTVFAYNNTGCSGGPAYKTASPLSGSFTTLAPPCTTPANQPTALSFSGTTSSTATASFTTTTADGYLVVYSTASTLTANPVNGTSYSAGATFGNATVVSSGTSNSFAASGLSATTTYYFYIFSYNNTNCSGGPLYKTTSPLTGTATTLEAPLYYYFGNFHSHSQYSDGSGLPSGDFSFGDTANCMDFLGISEHNHATAGMSLANYALGRSQAAAATTSSFLAMYGMEWGVISGGGHVVVYGVDKLVGWETGNYDIYVPQSVYTGSTGLFNVINSYSGSNAFATLAHPNNTDYNGIMSTYDSAADDAVVGSAVENGPSTSTDVTYTDPPSSMLYLSYYRNMLAKGYHLGPTMDHDNHNVTHGHTSTIRTAVMATALNESSVLSAMRAMRFYATEDCAAYVTFKVNNKQMGTIMTAAGAPTITVTTSTTNPVTSLKIYSGVSGSGSNATILTSTTTGTITFTHTALANLTSRYYYIDITESDGKRIVTAPIWYSRNDAARKASTAAVAEFLALPQTTSVQLKWMTTNEREHQHFTLERSYDNTYFTVIDTQEGKGAAATQNYNFVDDTAATGMVYYRLTQYNSDGVVVYTDTHKVDRGITSKYSLTVYPNPVGDEATLLLENVQSETIAIGIYDITGKMVYQQKFTAQQGSQEVHLPVQSLTSGIYFVKATTDSYAVTTKITKM